MENAKKNTNVIEDVFGFIGETIGQTVSLATDVVVGSVKGVVYDLPLAVVDGFQSGFEFMNDEPVNEEPVAISKETVAPVAPISKEDYKAKLLIELDRINTAIDSEKEVTVKL